MVIVRISMVIDIWSLIISLSSGSKVPFVIFKFRTSFSVRIFTSHYLIVAFVQIWILFFPEALVS